MSDFSDDEGSPLWITKPTSEMNLLLLVERVLDGFAVLLEHQRVEQRQVGGIVAYGVLDQQDGAHPAHEAVEVGVELVLEQLDDGDDEVGGVVPAEDIVYAGGVLLVQQAVDFAGERRQEHYRGVRGLGLHPVGEFEDVQLADVVHGDDEVETLPRHRQLQGVHGCLHPHDGRRIAEVQVGILLGDLRLDMPVFLESIAVVIVADKQDTLDPLAHQSGVVRSVVAHRRLFMSYKYMIFGSKILSLLI